MPYQQECHILRILFRALSEPYTFQASAKARPKGMRALTEGPVLLRLMLGCMLMEGGGWAATFPGVGWALPICVALVILPCT